MRISIHAPVWGATPSMVATGCGQLYFNPRTRVGCDIADQYRYCVIDCISIHAPVWGATL